MLTFLHFKFEHWEKDDISQTVQVYPTLTRQTVKEKLLLDESMSYLAGGDIASGLPLTTIGKITNECSIIVPYKMCKA